MNKLERSYITNNIKHHPQSYVNLLIVIVMSVIMINIMPIYIDSLANGSRLSAIEYTGGVSARIEEAPSSDMKYYKSIPGVKVEYSGDTFYFYELDPKKQNISSILSQIRRKNNLNDSGKLRTSEQMLESDGYEPGMLLTGIIFALFFAAIGAISLYYIYTMFIAKRSHDLALLKALGIADKRLNRMLFKELAIVYLIGFALGQVISRISAYIIFSTFFANNAEYLSQITYDYSFMSLLLSFAASGASLAAAFIKATHKINKVSPIENMYAPVEISKFDRTEYIHQDDTAVSYISNANLTRRRRPRIVCAAVMIPALILTLVIANICNAMLQPSYFLTDKEFRIEIDSIDKYEYSEQLKAAENAVKSVEGLDYRINLYKSISAEITDKLPLEPISMYKQNQGTAMISYCSDSELVKFREGAVGDFDLCYEDGYVLIPYELFSEMLNVGDTITLKSIDLKNNRNIISEVKIAAFINDKGQSYSSLPVLASESNYISITGDDDLLPSGITVSRGNSGMSFDEFDTWLHDVFDISCCEVINMVSHRNVVSEHNIGAAMLMFMICVAILLCAVVIVSAFSRDYVDNQSGQISILGRLGSESRTIDLIYLRDSSIKAGRSFALSMILGTVLSIVSLLLIDCGLTLNLFTFVIYIMLAVFTAAAYIVPTMLRVRKISKI